MNTFDIILIVLLGLGLIRGFMNGLIMELFFFLAFFVGLFLALELTVPATNYLFEGKDFYGAGGLVVFILLFILVVFLTRQLGKLLKKAVHVTFLGALDKLLGSVFGLLKMALLISIVSWVVESVGINISQTEASVVYPYVLQVGPELFAALGSLLPVFQDLIDSLEQMSENSSQLYT